MFGFKINKACYKTNKDEFHSPLLYKICFLKSTDARLAKILKAGV